MRELEKYGLLSVGSILALFLILTFHGGMPEPEADDDRLSDALDRSIDPLRARASGWRADSARLEATDFTAPEPGVSPRPPEAGSASPPQPPSGVAAGTSVHRVVRGDTLSGIAARYLGSARRWPEIAARNGLGDPRSLRVGQVLVIPRERDVPPEAPAPERRMAPGEPEGRGASPQASARPVASARAHRIEPGDTLSEIAKRYYDDARMWKAVYDANRDVVRHPEKLPVGATLRLP